MAEGRLCLVLFARAIRSFFNGLFCCSLTPYIAYCNFKGPPYMTGITIFLCVLASIFKQHLISKNINNPMKALYITFLFFLPTLFINDYNLTGSWPFVALKTIFLLGLYSADGEDFAFFEEAERALICPQAPNESRQEKITAYNVIGNLFQALGSISAYLYMTYDLQAIQYVSHFRLNNIFVMLYFIAVANIALFTAVQLRRAKEQSNNEAIEQQPSPYKPHIDNKLKAANFVNGLAVGALCAPFLAYFLDLKFNLHPHTVGVVIFALFLFKGVGEEAMRRLPSMKRLFECWNILSALSLAWVYFSADADSIVYCVLFAVPLWHFGRVALRQKLESSAGSQKDGSIAEGGNGANTTLEADAIMAAGRKWERGGTAAGILLSSFAFSILYSKSYFGYAFLISALFKVISQINITFLLGQVEVQKVEESKQLIEMESERDQLAEASRDNLGAEVKTITNQHYFLLNRLKGIWPVLIMACLVLSYTLYSYSTKLAYLNTSFKTRSEVKTAPPQLKLYNTSLAHMWTKEGVKRVALIDCDKDCTESIRKRDEYYAKMQYDSPNPQWVHFPNAPYFRTASQMREEVKMLQKYPSAKGFSFAWDDPLSYNKLPYEMYPILNEAGKEHGFYYAQMPSLNLRGPQYRVIKVFTKAQRKAVTLPPFVQRQPPKNYIAYQSTFKLSTNHQYLREFILYHLKLGYDKFFLYNNDREPGDPQFFWEYRDAGGFYQKCFFLGVSEEYQNMNEIWEDFYDHIIYVPMLIERRHNQAEAYINYGLFFRHEVVFTSFNDMDELVYSPSGLYLPDVLKKMAKEDNVAGLRLSARNFISRMCRNGQLTIEEPRWMVIPPGAATFKNTVMTRLLYDSHVHYKPPINGVFVDQTVNPDPREDFSLIHYKVTGTYEEITGNNEFRIDKALLPLVPGMKQACKGKCSDQRKITCAPDVYQQQMERYCVKE